MDAEQLEKMSAFEHKDEHTAQAYRLMFAGFRFSCKLEQAWSVLRKMRENGLPANVRMYNGLIARYSFQLQTKEAEQLVGEMMQVGIQPNSGTYSLIAAAYFQQAKLVEAYEVLRTMMHSQLEPNMLVSSAMVKTYCGLNRYADALVAAKFVLKKSRLRFTPYVYWCLMELYIKVAQLEKAEEVLTELRNRGIPTRVDTYKIFITQYLCKNREDDALRKLAEMRKDRLPPNEDVAFLFIRFYIKQGQLAKAREAIQDFEKEGLNVAHKFKDQSFWDKLSVVHSNVRPASRYLKPLFSLGASEGAR